jgi:predicted branched-subunit amino acid permease
VGKQPLLIYWAQNSVCLSLSTLAGSLLSEAIPKGLSPESLGIDFIFPVAFLALLIPLLKKRLDFLVAIFSGVTAFLLSRMLQNSSIAILVVGVVGSLLGAFFSKNEASNS